MANMVADMTRDELKEILGELIEAKLAELFVDPDGGLELQAAFRQRLERQRAEVASGERGLSFSALTKQLGLA